ncbi:hypothetical protein SISNIDRAFT_482191 [Sistotremastrum niveocremeum HHB9708]|uniref:Fungal-type protein kinase domain-containing protein n=1 Tax=Sistotremastrum niveocremeum HHB9708 TaxID=1314777 RepID=A0A164YUZ3_9AGAM|nr:hypothetical protein SISNIDRAFT_482191 [Sistotremastrum niveocremeum HHB9708]
MITSTKPALFHITSDDSAAKRSASYTVRSPQAVADSSLSEKIADRTDELDKRMFIDADHAMDWRDKTGIRFEHRLGTLPYISLRFLDVLTWYTTEKVPNSVMDDLEPFIWVLLHVLVLKVKFKRQELWLRQLGELEQGQHYTNRFAMRAHFDQDARWDSPRDHNMLPFVPFLTELFSLAHEGAKDAQTLELLASANQLTSGHSLETCEGLQGYYLKYLDLLSAASKSESLSKSWKMQSPRCGVLYS